MEAKAFISVTWPTCLMTVLSCMTVEKIRIFSFTWRQKVLEQSHLSCQLSVWWAGFVEII